MRIITHSGSKAALCALAFAFLFVFGCTPKEEPIVDIAVSSVSLSPASLELEEGQTATITATVNPSNATRKTVSWSSSNASVTTVSGGKVTAVAAGSATITATADGKSATCTVTVKKKVIAVTGITLNPTSVTITVGETATLTATVSPADATDKTVTWSSSDAKIATVKDGTVTAVAAGTTKITATAGGKTATCEVTVKAKEVPVTGITLDPTSVSIEEGQTATLTATVSPADATDKTVTWTSSDTKVATVRDGTVTAIAVGTATITAKAGDKTATCQVTVKAVEFPVTNINIIQTSISIEVGDTFMLTAIVTPSNATDKTITWSSSNESVATVKDGKVTAVAVGTATITAKAGDKSDTCEVTVIPDPEMDIKTALMKIYNALDGPHWTITNKWDLSKPLSEWDRIRWDSNTGELELESRIRVGMKGQLPDCFDELTGLTTFFIQDEPGLTGPLPASFAQLKNLRNLTLVMTSITSLPDIFSGMPLEEVFLSGNESLTGPLPESLGSSMSLGELNIQGNKFTGTVPDSWARLGTKLVFRREGLLDPHVPDSFVTAPDAAYLINMYLALASFELRTTSIEVGDYDIPAYFPQRGLKDVVTGQSIPYKQIYSKNKATILLNWGTWCPFSKDLMPLLKRMYEKYHKDGLEIIAGINPTSDEVNAGTAKLKSIIQDLGYDQWYNFSMYDLWTMEWDIWAEGTPSAIIVDKDGNIVTSSHTNINDPSRNRFGYMAPSSLIPLLESMFGPLEGDDGYSSTDYSQDGKVITIQKATKGKGINLVFMGDAYTDKDIESGQYERLMRNSADQFFSIEPYASFRDRFNVYAVVAVSKNGKTGPGYTTALGAKMVNGSAVTGNREKVLEYALKVPGITDKNNLAVGVLVNSIYYGGIADLNETYQSGIGYYSSMGNDPYVFGSTLRHETGGHAFAFLADEYATQSGSPSQSTINEYNRLYNTYGWYSNIDFMNDPAKVRWHDFLSDSRYKDEVGIFEGGGNLRKGVYRPSVNSMMNQNMEYFNAPSRWAIYKRIMELSGETASFSKFLEYDAVNRGQQHNAPRRASNYVEWEPDAMPVVTR